MKTNFSVEDKRFLLRLVENTISDYIRTGKRYYPHDKGDRFLVPMGVFITLRRSGRLRGCIGYPLPVKPLLEAVVDNAIAAATEDPRFPPVTEEELQMLEIEISILTPPEKIDDPAGVVVGRDGIIISQGAHRGLLLPQVPVEQGWDREQYLNHGCLKAGLPPDEWKKNVSIEIFQAEVFSQQDLDIDPRKENEA